VPRNTTDLVLTLTNGLSSAATFTITPNHYTSWSQRLTGHLENGLTSVTG
jgi:hypothetical protein